MNDGTSLRGNKVREFCNKYHIEGNFFTPYYTQGNGHSKGYNKFIKSMLSITIEKHGKDWHK